jgi:gluconolactonase
MKRVLLVVLALGVSFAQPPAERPFKIIRLDAAFDDIISPDAKLETLGDHFGLTEGPVWVQRGGDGYLLFSDNAGNEIYKWSPHAPLSVFLQKSGYTGHDVTNAGAQTVSGGGVAILLIGSNGLTLDRDAGRGEES